MSAVAEAGRRSGPPGGRDGALDAFISYSHRDAEFVLALKSALEQLGRNVWIDADDIPPGAPWRRELGSGIEAADSFVFVISPDSVASPECRKELDRAVELGKRMVPVLLRPTQRIPADLVDYQFVDATSVSELDDAVGRIEQALDTDHDWVRAHTHWLARALRWDEHGRDRSHLLRRGGDLQAAEAWLARQAEGKKPPPTPLQTEYIVASREAEKRRLRTLLAAAFLAVAVSVALAIFALVQRSEAIAQRDQAYSRELAAKAVSELSVDPELGILLALEAEHVERTPESRDALRRALVESHVRETLRGHEDSILGLAFDAEGGLVASASTDGTARLWDATTGDEVAVLRGHEGTVRSAVFGPGGKLLLTASEDGTARVWPVGTGADPVVLRGHEGPVWTAAFSRDGRRVVTAGEDGTARVFQARTGAAVAVLRGHRETVESAVFGLEGRTVVTASADETVRIWDVATGSSTTLGEHEQPLFSAALDRRGKRALLLAADVATVWDVASGSQVADLGQAFEARFSPDGGRILTATIEGSARIWAVATGEEIAVLRASHAGPILDAAWSADGAFVVTTGLDRIARVWDPATGEVLATLRGHTGSVDAVAFSPDGDTVATAGGDRTIRLWDLPVATVLRGHGLLARAGEPLDPDVVSADFSADGTRVVTAATDATARLWDAQLGKEVRTPAECEPPRGMISCFSVAVALAHLQFLTDAEFGANGTRVVTAGRDGTARVWDAATAENVALLSRHEGPVWSASFSLDGEHVVTAGEDGTTRVWDAASGDELAVLRHDEVVAGAVFHPDGEVVATNGADETLRLWDWRRGTEARVVAMGVGGVGGVAFSPDGRLVATPAGQDAKVFDAETGAELTVVRGHSGLVVATAFTPDGRLVATAAQDGTARIWEIDGGREVLVLRGSGEALSDVAFSPDGARVVTAAADATARIHLCEVCAPFDELLVRAREGLTRGLNAEERQRLLASG